MSSHGTTTELEERQRAVRDRLVSAARGIFVRDGFHDARIVDIAADAQVGVSTFYRHFDTKVAAFCAVISDLFDEIYASGSTKQLTPRTPAERISAANRSFWERYRRDAKLHAVFEQLAPIDAQCCELYLRGRDRAARRIAAAITHWQVTGRADAGLDALQAARLLVAMTNNYAHLCHNLGELADNETTLATLDRLWIGALGLRER
jgi:AcrR family transcriptional regulator